MVGRLGCGLAQTERQGAVERLCMALGHKLVPGGTTLLLRALRGQQVPEAGRAANKLSGTGNLEPLGDGLFGLLHGESGRKQRAAGGLARVFWAFCDRTNKSPGELTRRGGKSGKRVEANALRQDQNWRVISIVQVRPWKSEPCTEAE